MQKSKLRVSIVIPAYNEQDHIGACLQAIARQTVKPFEVIVVDNNSSDNTASVANQFPFVTLASEPKQGVVNARDCGFNLASGDIIGRIDADTIITDDWVAKLQDIFSNEQIKAVSGGLHFHDIGWSKLIDSIDAYWRAWMARRMTPHQRVFLLGSNMAIRRSAWQAVSQSVCHRAGLHEDLDLALHLSEAKQLVVFEPSLMVNLSARRIDTGLGDLYRYSMINPRTYAHHNAKEHRYMYPLIVIVLVNYIPLRILFRAFDSTTKRFSLKLIFTSGMGRVNPANYM